jgi:hypothetical protein
VSQTTETAARQGVYGLTADQVALLLAEGRRREQSPQPDQPAADDAATTNDTNKETNQ